MTTISIDWTDAKAVAAEARKAGFSVVTETRPARTGPLAVRASTTKWVKSPTGEDYSGTVSSEADDDAILSVYFRQWYENRLDEQMSDEEADDRSGC